MDRFFLRFVTMYAFDRRTDTFLIASPRWHSMQRGKCYRTRSPRSSLPKLRSRFFPTSNLRSHVGGPSWLPLRIVS